MRERASPWSSSRTVLGGDLSPAQPAATSGPASDLVCRSGFHCRRRRPAAHRGHLRAAQPSGPVSLEVLVTDARRLARGDYKTGTLAFAGPAGRGRSPEPGHCTPAKGTGRVRGRHDRAGGRGPGPGQGLGTKPGHRAAAGRHRKLAAALPTRSTIHWPVCSTWQGDSGKGS